MAHGSLPDSPFSPGRVRTAWLDWEDEQRDEPSRYASVKGPNLVTVLDAVQKAVIDVFRQDGRDRERVTEAFSDYRRGATRMPEYATRFAGVLVQSQQAGSSFAAADAATLLKSFASAGLAISGHPVGVLGLTPGQIAASAQAAGHLSEAAVRAVTGKKPGEISPEEYDLVTDSARELTRRAAAAVREVAARGPLVVLLDTGEVIGVDAWAWLRRMMTQTGPSVIWVVGARFETEAEAGVDSPVAQFVRDIGDEHLVLMSPTRFDDVMIRDYLRGRTSRDSYTDAHIDMISRFTRGLPLAVSFVGELLCAGQQVEDVCREVDGGIPGSVVSRLARRYLVHAEHQTYSEDDPRHDDVAKILGLALAFGDLRSDPELLAKLWNVADPLAAFQDLARRHDFVLPVSRRLHKDVRDTLRKDLLDPFRRDRAREINQRALDLLQARLQRMRVRWPTLDEQVGHTTFVTAVLSVLWHTWWIDNQAGLDLFTQILPVFAVADPDTSTAAAEMVEEFAAAVSEDQRHDLDLITFFQPEAFYFHPEGPLEGPPEEWRGKITMEREGRRTKFTLEGLALQSPAMDATDFLVGEFADRQVAVTILRAQLQSADHNDKLAIATLQAATQTSSNRFRRAIGFQAEAIADRLIFAGPQGTPVRTITGVAAAKIAIEMLPGSTSAWQSYAIALSNIYRWQDALHAFDHLVTLSPDDAFAHFNRGIALEALGRLEEALAAYDQAISLAPDHASFHNNRGNTLYELGRFADALAAQDQVITLEPGVAGAHNNRGVTLQALGRLEETLAAYDQAISLAPDDASAHVNKGVALAEKGHLDEALTEFDIAQTLEPTGVGEGTAWAAAILWHQHDFDRARDRFALVDGRVAGCTAFRTREIEAVALCGLGEADNAEQHLLEALPLRAPIDHVGIPALYDLLSDPPLPGINRLRTISDSDT